MANINVSVTEYTITVDETTSNINVSTTTNTINVGNSAIVTPSEVRTLLSNTFPITYSNATGVIGIDSSASFIGKTTDDLPEKVSAPSNLYFTQTRARQSFARQNISGDGRLEYNSGNGIFSYFGPEAANYRAVFSAVSPLNYNSSTGVFSVDGNALLAATTTDSLAEGTTNLYYSNARVGAYVVDAGLDFNVTKANAAIVDYIDSNPLTVGGNLTVNGNINATGNINYQNVTDLYVTDQKITLNSNATVNADVEIIANRPQNTNTMLKWNESTDRWTFTNDGTTYYNIATSTTDVAEGANLYFTTARANSAISLYTDKLQGGGLQLGFANVNNWGALTGGLFFGEQGPGSATYLYSPHTLTYWGELQKNNGFKIDGSTGLGVDTKGQVLGAKWFANWNNIRSSQNTSMNDFVFAKGSGTYANVAPNSNAAGSNGIITAGDVIHESRYLAQYADYEGDLFKWTKGLSWTVYQDNSVAAPSSSAIPIAGEYTVNVGGSVSSPNTQSVLKIKGDRTLSFMANTLKSGANGNAYITADGAFTSVANISGAFLNGNGSAITGLTTTQVSEGTNFYFTAARVRGNVSATTATGISYDGGTGVFSLANIPNSSLTNSTITINGKVVALGGSNTLTTSDIAEGTNLYFTASRVRGNISAGENITYNSTTGVIGLSNALANVNSVSSEANTSFTINTNGKLVLTQKFKNTTTFTGNIQGDGYAPFNITTAALSHSGTGALNSFLITAGNTVSGNATITGVTVAERVGTGTATATLANITQYYAYGNTFGTAGFLATYPFPPGTYVSSVDVANSTITMSQAAAANVNFTTRTGTNRAALLPGAYDSSTGYLIGIRSTRAASGSGSATTIAATADMIQGTYGYPQTGPAANNFVYSVDTANDYAVTSAYSNKMIARTGITAPSTVFQAPRGMIVGNGDLTNRAENDSLPSFGINLLWDGLTTSTDYAGNTPITQLLLKQYSDNTIASTNPERGAARILFTAAQGNKNQPYASTYLRKNSELGRITWWAPTDTTTNLSTLAAPAFINAVANRDMTGSHNGGIGLYLMASPHTDSGDRGLMIAHQLGNTLIASSSSTTSNDVKPIIFAPMYWDNTTNTAANSTLMFDTTIGPDNYQWAYINHDDPTNYLGSRISVTNGVSNVPDFNGNLTLALDRNDNGAGFGNKEWAFKLQPGNTSLALTEDGTVRASFASGGNVNISGNINLTGRLLGYDRVYGEFYHSANINPVAADTIYAFPLDTTVISSDVVANNTSRINIIKPGIYKLFMSLQVKNSNNAADHLMRFWLRKNGADVAGSATVITPLKLQEQVVSMHWMVESDGDDYWEIVYYVNSTEVVFPYYGTLTTPVTAPAAPPIIVNVIPVGA